MEDECLFIDPNMENFHDILNPNQELFLDFPSPFFDDISTNPTHTNNYNHQHHITSPNKNINITDSPSESMRVKKRNVGKKDRHSKIHTAQGLRDRRMRLSLHIARKFFDLQDLLGFDKASNTIEWLFCKSNKAIKEVAESFSSQNTNQSMSEENFDVGFITTEIKNVTSNHENPNQEIKNTRSKKRIQDNSSVRETRDQARTRARNRTRERLMIKELEKSKQLVDQGNPNQEIYKLGLGHIAIPNNHNAEELGFITSSPSEPIQPESSSSSLEHSITHRLLQEPQSSTTINPNSFEKYSGSNASTSTYCSTMMNHNPPAGWLNSYNGFLDGEWITDSFVTEFYNCGIVPTTVSLTGDIYEQSPSSFLMSSSTTNLQ